MPLPSRKEKVEDLVLLDYAVLAYYLRGLYLVRINDGKAISMYRHFLDRFLSKMLGLAFKPLKVRIVHYVIAFKAL